MRVVLGVLSVLVGVAFLAIGVLVGLRVPTLGLAAAGGLVLLLLGAVVHHLLRGDLLQSGLLSVVLLLLSGAVLALRVRTSRAAVPAVRRARPSWGSTSAAPRSPSAVRTVARRTRRARTGPTAAVPARR